MKRYRYRSFFEGLFMVTLAIGMWIQGILVVMCLILADWWKLCDAYSMAFMCYVLRCYIRRYGLWI